MRIGAVAVVVLAFLAGCARDVSAPTDASAAGIYHLAEVNGKPLPLLLQSDGNLRVDVTESVLTLNADRTWSEVTAFRLNDGTSTTTESDLVTGTYSIKNSAIALTSSGGSTSTGAVSRNLLTLIGAQFNLVYRR